MASKKCSILFLASIACILLGCNGPNNTAASNRKEFDEITNYLQSLVDTGYTPGITVAIIEGDKITYVKAFGIAGLHPKTKLQPSNTFHVASIAKTFTAAAVMQLAEKGKIDINLPLVKYLPYFRLNDDRYKLITIKEMLNHTSGMPDVEDYEWEKAIGDNGAAERYTRSLSDKKMISDPGKEFHYSNMAYDVLGDLIAKVSGMSFEKYEKQNILDPLEMYESSFYYPEIKKSLRTEPFSGRPPVVSAIYPYNRMHAPSSTLNTNVLELANWAIANIHEGKFKGKQIFTTATWSAMMAPTFSLNEDYKAGLGWFMYKYKGDTNYEKDGWDVGYKSFITLIPAKKIGIVILSNYDRVEFNIGDIRNKIRDILLLGKPPI